MISCALLALALAVCVGLDRFGRSARRFGAVRAVGRDPIRPTLVALPEDAYRFWKRQGFHGRTILCLADSWDRLNLKEYAEEDDARRSYPLKVYRFADHFEEKFLDSRNFLYVAALQGIARKIVAVLSPAAFDLARDHAHHAKNARVDAQEVYETHEGFPRWFTTLGGLTPPGEPVLIYVSASMFRSARPEELLAALSRRGVRSDAVLLCSLAGDRTVSDTERRALGDFARLLERGAHEGS